MHSLVPIGRFSKMTRLLGPAGTPVTGAPFVYHTVIDEQNAGDIESCIPIAYAPDFAGDVVRVDVPAHVVASTVHRGPYDELLTEVQWPIEHDATT